MKKFIGSSLGYLGIGFLVGGAFKVSLGLGIMMIGLVSMISAAYIGSES